MILTFCSIYIKIFYQKHIAWNQKQQRQKTTRSTKLPMAKPWVLMPVLEPELSGLTWTWPLSSLKNWAKSPDLHDSATASIIQEVRLEKWCLMFFSNWILERNEMFTFWSNLSCLEPSIPDTSWSWNSEEKTTGRQRSASLQLSGAVLIRNQLLFVLREQAANRQVRQQVLIKIYPLVNSKPTRCWDLFSHFWGPIGLIFSFGSKGSRLGSLSNRKAACWSRSLSSTKRLCESSVLAHWNFLIHFTNLDALQFWDVLFTFVSPEATSFLTKGFWNWDIWVIPDRPESRS